MYADVVVLTYQPPGIQYYTYEIPKNLEREIKVGQLVSVPFGKRMPYGVVVNLAQRVIGDIGEIREVREILLKQPLLLPFQIELLRWMAFYYHAPMVNCLETMIPEIPRRSINDQAHLRGVKAHPEGEGYQQTIVLVPSINRLPETLAQYPHAKNYAVYHNELRQNDKFEAWLKILSGKVDYVFGSRSAIFSPCPELKEIIIYDEHDGAYKDERSPYFDTLTVAQKISQLSGAKIKIIDSSPKITTYFLSKQTRFVKILQTGFELTPKVKIISMIDEKKAGNRSPLSQILEDYIKLGFAKKKKNLLFLNKKSESGHIWCKNCKYSDFAQKQPDVCPNCGSADIWFNSLNVNSLASLVQKIIPSAKVNIITQSTQLSNYRTIQLPTIDIATAAVFYKLLPQKYDLVAHIRTDSMLTIADWASTERLYWQITDLKKITRGLLLLQTYNPENEVLIAAENGNYLNFYNSQLPMRKTLLYPPFTLLVKLSLKGKNEENVEQKSQQLFDNLTTQLSNLPTTQLPIILGPYRSSFPPKIPKYNIILKMPVSNYDLPSREKALTQLATYLKQVPKDWQIIVEPDSIN